MTNTKGHFGKLFLNFNKNTGRFSSHLLLGLVLLCVILLRLRLLNFPLERDEGEFAYIGKLILEGIPPYSEAANMKLPGTYYMYALIMALFGQTTAGIHIGLLLVNLASVFLVFKLTEKLTNPFTAIFSAASFAFLSFNSSVLGFAAHATHFLMLPALGGTLLLFDAVDKYKPGKLFLGGSLMGISFIMKQPGAFFILFAFFINNLRIISEKPRKWKKLIYSNGILFCGSTLPFLLPIVYLNIAGVSEKFNFWVFQYAFQYGESITLSEAASTFAGKLLYAMDGFYLFWILALVGSILLFISPITSPVGKIFISLFTVFSFLTIIPGYHFRPHYFILLLPALSIFIGYAINYWKEALANTFILPVISRFPPALLFIAILLYGLYNNKNYFLHDDQELSREIYELAPFAESEKIAAYIKSNTDANDKIFVFGNEPQIYFHSGRHSATSYMYLYPLMEKQDYNLKMQKEMIAEVETAEPEFIVITQTVSWNIQANSEMFIFKWLHEYTQLHYILTGVIDIMPGDSTVYKWGDEALKYVPVSNFYLLVLKRSHYEIPNNLIRYNYQNPRGPLASGLPYLDNQPSEETITQPDAIETMPVNLALPSETNDIVNGIDTLVMNQNVLKVSGWAFINGHNAENSIKYICLKSESSVYVFKTKIVSRPEISRAFGYPNLDEAGFSALIETGGLAPGIYTVGLLISKDRNIEGLQYTNYRVTVVEKTALPATE